MTPIWKDYFVDLTEFFGDAQFVDYTIEVNGTTVYTGRAYKAPAGEDTLVRINDICADYLGHMDLRTIFPGGGILPIDLTDRSAMRMFRVMVGVEMVDEVEFFNCWDYTHNELVTGDKLSATIGNEYVTEMPVVRTAFGGRLVFDPVITHYPSVDSSYKRVECCNPAALYFYNAQCGWDFLLCKGGAKRIHDYERNTMKRAYNNENNERGTINYMNVESIAWDVYTGRLADRSAANIGQLVGSCDVWLWTPESGLVPVVMVTSEAQELTYKKNGRRPVEYTLRVELAQDRQRR